MRHDLVPPMQHLAIQALEALLEFEEEEPGGRQEEAPERPSELCSLLPGARATFPVRMEMALADLFWLGGRHVLGFVPGRAAGDADCSTLQLAGWLPNGYIGATG